MSEKRQRFDVRTLDRYEFVDYVLEYLKNNIGITVESSNRSNHLAFYKGSIRVKNKQLPVAIIGYGGSGTDLRDLLLRYRQSFCPWYSSIGIRYLPGITWFRF